MHTCPLRCTSVTHAVSGQPDSASNEKVSNGLAVLVKYARPAITMFRRCRAVLQRSVTRDGRDFGSAVRHIVESTRKSPSLTRRLRWRYGTLQHGGSGEGQRAASKESAGLRLKDGTTQTPSWRYPSTGNTDASSVRAVGAFPARQVTGSWRSRLTASEKTSKRL